MTRRRTIRRAPTPGEDDFCRCGGVFVRGSGSARHCAACGEYEPTKRLRVRLPDDSVKWMPVGAAIGRGR